MQDNHPNKGKAYWGVWANYTPPTVDKTTGEKIKTAYKRGDTWDKMGEDYGFSTHRLAYVLRTLGVLPEFRKVRTTAERRRTAYRARAKRVRNFVLIEFAEGGEVPTLAKKYKLPEKYIRDLLSE